MQLLVPFGFLLWLLTCISALPTQTQTPHAITSDNKVAPAAAPSKQTALQLIGMYTTDAKRRSWLSSPVNTVTIGGSAMPDPITASVIQTLLKSCGVSKLKAHDHGVWGALPKNSKKKPNAEAEALANIQSKLSALAAKYVPNFSSRKIGPKVELSWIESNEQSKFD